MNNTTTIISDVEAPTFCIYFLAERTVQVDFQKIFGERVDTSETICAVNVTTAESLQSEAAKAVACSGDDALTAAIMSVVQMSR